MLPFLRKRRICAFLFALLIGVSFVATPLLRALDDTKPLRSYGRQNWQTGSGLPQNTVHAILQSRSGFLWLGTEGGLLRFDGVAFTLFDTRTTPALRSNLILGLAESADGVLLAATSQGLLTMHSGQWTLLTASNGLPGNAVLRVLCARQGICWVVTAEGVASYRDGVLHPFPVAPALANSSEQPVAALAPDGSLWMATAEGLAHLSPGGLVATEPLPAPASAVTVAGDGEVLAGGRGRLFRLRGHARSAKTLPAGLEITTVLASRGGAVYLGTSSGLGVLHPDASSREAFSLLTTKDGLPDNRVTTALEDSDGALWIGTEHGAARLFRGRLEALDLGEGSGPVLTLAQDREGDVWLGTDAGGLTVLRDRTFTTYTVADGLPSNALRSVYAGRDNTIWVGTSGAGLSRSTGAAFTVARDAGTGLSSNTVLALAESADGTLAIGTPDGLDLLKNGKLTRMTSAEGLPDDFIRSLLASGGNELWIGTRHGLAHWLPGTRTADSHIDIFGRNEGLPSDVVGALAEDRQHPGAIWAGTLDGLVHLDRAGHVTTYAQAQGLASVIVTALYQQADGTLWIGTSGGGLYRLVEGHISAYAPQETGLPQAISSILEDGSGRLWLGTASGIFRVAIADLNAYAADKRHPLRVAAYGVSDGMLVPECSSGHPAAARGPRGELWFATLKGLSMVDAEALRENRLVPPVAIEEVSVDEQPVSTTAPFRVPPDRTRLAFHYAGLSFTAPAKVHYRYQMQGFDKHWIDAGTRRTAYYTNIPPGHYTFRVLAANNDGVWNETGAAIQFSVEPHYYQTWWFYTLLALGLAGCAYALYRLRVRAVEQRFSAVLGERNRIAREIHDTLAQDIVAISVQLELASRLLSSSAEAARAQLDATRTLVKNSLAEARSSIWNLRSATAGGNDLPARLSRSVREIATAAGLQFSFQVNGAYRTAPARVEDELARIATQAAQNAARHASATRLELTLSYAARSLQLTVADDGRGFVPDPEAFAGAGHFGLQGMRERAAAIGARLHIESKPGTGTRITVRADIP